MQNVEMPGQNSSGSRILHPGSRKLFRYWESLRAERPFPGREELVLREIKDLLPDLVIIEQEPMPKGFGFRLAGTAVCDLFKGNLTGTAVLWDWGNFERDIIEKHLAQTLVNLQPTLLRMRLTTDNDINVAVEFIGLPVQKRGGAKMQILGGFFPFRPAASLNHSRVQSRTLLAIRSVWTEYQDCNGPGPQPSGPAAREFRVIAGGRTP